MRKFLTALAFGLLASAVLNATPAAAKTMTLPVYGRDRNTVPDAVIPFLPIGMNWVIADADGDGRDDVLFWGGSLQTEPNSVFDRAVPILAYHNLGGGRFELVLADQLIGGNVPDIIGGELSAAELNGDGRFDVLVANFGQDFEPFPGDKNLLFLSRPTAGLAMATEGFPQFSDTTGAAAVGDIDDDGDADIFFGSSCCGEIGPYFLLNDGTGNFIFDQSRLPVSLLEANAGRGVLGDTMELPMDAELIDVSGDGHVDLALGLNLPASRTKASGVVVLNDGTGNFSEADFIEFPAGLFGEGDQTTTIDILPMDVNRDGLPDFILSQASSFQAGPRIQILIGNGDGTFHDESFRFPNHFGSISEIENGFVDILDTFNFNNDGDLDLFIQVAAGGTPVTLVFVNNGSGFFREIPDDIIPNTRTPGHDLNTALDLALLPIRSDGSQLDFLGPEYQCFEFAPITFLCTKATVKTSLFNPIGSRVVALNFAPGALADSYTGRMNRTLEVSAAAGVLANDIEPDGQSMTVSLVGQPANGTVTLNADSSLTYQPDWSFIGTDSFTYKASDGALASNVATVTITVETIAMPWLELLLSDD